MTNKHKSFLAGLVAATSFSVYAGESQTCKATYETQREVLANKYSQSEKAFAAKYLAALENMQSKYQAAANLDGVVAVKNECDRFKSHGTLAAKHVTKDIAPLHKLQSQALAAYNRIATAKSRENLLQAKKYNSELSEMMVALTRQGEIKEAMKVRDEMARLKSDPAVVMAQRFLAVAAATQANKQQMMPVTTRATEPQPIFASPGKDKGKDGKDKDSKKPKTGG